MKRRNTIDCFHGTSWPMCQYYYTHNTGSCDDILLNKRDTVYSARDIRNTTIRRSVRVRKKRRYTYPVVLLNQQAYTRQFLENNNTKTPGLILRRWSTISQQKKRRTLADKISNITTGENSPDTTDNIGDNSIRSMALETSLNGIQRQYSMGYKTQLQDEEKSENKEQLPPPPPPIHRHQQQQRFRQSGTPLLRVVNDDKEEVIDEKAEESPTASFAIDIPHTEANTSTTLMDSGVNINSSLIAHPPSSSVNLAEQINYNNKNLTMSNSGNGENNSSIISDSDEDSIAIPMPVSEHSYSSNSSFDMLLFLFGFLFFPLWWVGAWKYIMQTQTKSNMPTKRREVFQILNCCMSLASLILFGLIIGLVTVWA